MIAYCINLSERLEKWERASKQFRKLPFNVLKFSATKKVIGFDGCRESHLNVLEHARVNYPGELITVFEDDVKFLGNHPWFDVERAMEELPKDWDMLYLGATLTKPVQRYSEHLFRMTDGAWTTHAMIFNNQNGIIEHILENNGGGRKIDVYYANEIQKRFNCYIAYPMIATQQDGFSDIQNKNVNNSMIIQDYYNKFTR